MNMETINELTKDIVLMIEDAFGSQISQTVKPQGSLYAQWVCPSCNLSRCICNGNQDARQAKEQYPKQQETIVGWKCPNCGAGMAPWAMRCTCQDINKGTWY